jgi:succinoglycan biosynthesis transport protein ExoP
VSTVLDGEPTIYLQYQPLADLPDLTVISAGFRPAGPTKFLASPEMRELMAQWRSEYDHIIIDTPPVLPFADALVMSAMADGVILVARSGVSRQKALVRARDILARMGTNIIGFVLNSVKRRESYYDYPQYQLAARDEGNVPTDTYRNS